MTWLLILALFSLIGTSVAAAVYHAKARAAELARDDVIARLANESARAIGEERRLEAVIRNYRTGLEQLEEDLHACAIQDPAAVGERLRRLLSGGAAGGGGAGEPLPRRAPATGAGGGGDGGGRG